MLLDLSSNQMSRAGLSESTHPLNQFCSIFFFDFINGFVFSNCLAVGGRDKIDLIKQSGMNFLTSMTSSRI
ncbi:hypothetical protein KFK09_022101 [Dendrobium nobile]|uniref:Uncharacterized protein n=1 Tax=Dendrobium nobile TaxID=94219 RepID=A0A8T3AI20_DENNO|nr:hypothetical protein KFK09_022101 [Dendrobium nobile]